MKFSIRKRHNNLRVMCVMLLAVLIGAPFFLRATQVSAGAVSWMESEPALKSTRLLDPAKDPYHEVRSDCKIETVTVVKSFYSPRDPKMQLAVCLARLGEYRIGQRNDGAREVYVSRGDEPFYKVSGIGGVYMKEQLPGVVFTLSHSRSFGYDESVHIRKYTNFTSRLAFNNDKTAYLLNEENPDFALAWGGNRAYASGWGISNNGRYLVYGSGSNYAGSYDLFARVDLQTGERKMFGKGYYEHTHNVEPQPGFVVSNDGTQVVASGTAIFKTWRITPKCLVDRDKMDQFKDPCEFKFIYPKFYGDQWKNLEASHERMMINDEFTELTYQHRALRGQAINEVVTISIAKHESETPRLDYLALGDSYSSGEGDIQSGVSGHYIRDTKGKDDCHLSDRSYPFLLAKAWRVPDGKFNTVACSGARVIHDYIFRLKYYSGQNEVIKRKFAQGSRDEIIKKSLDNFLPGYIPQLEFVKKYQPKIVTLTGGGNDVGFGDILRACIIGNWQSPSICTHAIPGSRLNNMLKDSIHNQYGVTKLLIKKIREVSPKTKIYIIGYPQFIKTGSQNCYLNATFINSLERSMIVDMTQEMNEVLFRAATDSGVPFIDISHSLVGGRLCDISSVFVTGSHDLLPNMNSTTVQNLFHPSPLGHKKIAKDILSRVNNIYHNNDKPSSTEISTAKPGYVYEQAPVTSKLNTDHQLQAEPGAPLHIQTEDRLKSGSKVKVTLYSTPRDLGEYVVGGDGKVNLNLAMPKDIEPGQHTVVLDGVSDGGKSVTYYGFVAVATMVKSPSAKDFSVMAQPDRQAESDNDTDKKPQNASIMDRDLPYFVAISLIIIGGVTYVICRLKY